MAPRNAAVIIVTTVFALFAAPAFSEDVPLPAPAPQAKSGDSQLVPPASIPDTSGAAPASSDSSGTAPASNHGFFPFSLPFGSSAGSSAKSGDATAFTAQQRTLLDRVSKYLSGIQTLVGNFVQIAPDGSRTEGTFYIQKPGKVRFEYNPPSPIDVIADGSSVAVRNRDLATQDLWPLSQTPLRYLLADHINLLRDTDVVSVSADDKFISVVVQEKQAVVGTSRLLMMFDAKDLTLKQWTVTDPQGLDTTVSVYNLDSTVKPDPKLFVINYQRTPTIGNQ
jgi:outer membrane lipoprotein-sorting protein